MRVTFMNSEDKRDGFLFKLSYWFIYSSVWICIELFSKLRDVTVGEDKWSLLFLLFITSLIIQAPVYWFTLRRFFSDNRNYTTATVKMTLLILLSNFVIMTVIAFYAASQLGKHEFY